MADDDQARKKRAERLHEEIESLKSGRPPPPPASPREFVEERAQEQREAELDKGPETEPEEEGES